MTGCELGRVLEAILKCILQLRAKFGVDMQSAFRQVGVEPDGASRFAYIFGQVHFAAFTCSLSGEGAQGGGGWPR